MNEEEIKTEAELEQEGTTPEETSEEILVQDESVLPESKESGDPLDTIEDINALRQEAKKYRSVAQRKSKPVAEKPKVVVNDSPYMTKKDFELVNEKKAILKAKEDKEIADNFDEISKWYVNRNGRDTEETILKDIKIAYRSWKANSEEEPKNPTEELAATTVAKPSGSPVKTEKKEKDDPRFALPPEPKDWYKTK